MRYHDADVTAFGYAYGQLPGCPEAFAADPKLINVAESCIRSAGLNAVQGLICSGDAFVHGADNLARIQQHFPQIAAVEMEAAGVAHVCNQCQLPFVVVRAISDVADKEASMSFEEFLPVAAQQSSVIVAAMLKQLNTY